MTSDAPSTNSPRRLSPKARLGLAALGIAAVAAAALLIVKRPTRPTDAGTDVAAPGEEDYGAWYDWVLGQGPVADGHRRLATTPLIEVLAGGQFLPRLVKTLEFKNGVASLEIRDAVYWSDETGLQTSHINDGLRHALDGVFRNNYTPDKTQEKLIGMMRVAQVEVTGLRTLRITLPDVYTQADVQALVASTYMLPVRKDLLEAEGGATKAWQTTIGPYRPKEEPKAKLPKASVVEYVPNPMFYRGVASKGTEMKLPTTARSL